MAVDNFIEEHPPWQRLLSSISGGSIEIEALTVTENGTYSEEGKAYSPVTVNVSGGGDVPEGYYFISIDENLTLSKTWNEINTMYDNGNGFIIVPPLAAGSNNMYVGTVFNLGSNYGVALADVANPEIEEYYVTDSADGYPVYTDEPPF